MGRGRRYRVGIDRRYKKNIENIGSIRSTEQLEMFIEREPGPVAESLLQMDLIGFNRDGSYKIEQELIDDRVRDLRKAIVDTRELPREETERSAAEIGRSRGLTSQQVINAVDREYRAQAQAIRLAARLSGYELSPAEKRTLTQADDSVYRAAYGSRGQFEGGTLENKLGIARRSGPGRSSDPSARARARENAERLRETAGTANASGRNNPANRRGGRPDLSHFARNRRLSDSVAQRSA